MKTYKVHSKTDKEIIFHSVKDLEGFFEEVSNGSWCIVEYKNKGKQHGIVISPDVSALIRENKFTIRSEEEIK